MSRTTRLKLAGRHILVIAFILLLVSCGEDRRPVEPTVQLPPEGFILIDVGEGAVFNMGSPLDEIGRYDNEVLHQVKLTQSFFICAHEVTQNEWVETTGWSESSFPGALLPACELTWYDALAYCNSISLSEGLTPPYTLTSVRTTKNHIYAADVAWNREADGYRLPTEAEWEYACRAGTTTAFSSGASTQIDCSPLDSVLAECGWYCGNAGGTPHEIMTKRPNPLGLYDMHGNIWEWCWDRMGPYESGPATDPTGPETGSLRVARGGCWSRGARICRSADRGYGPPEHPSSMLGLRVVRNAS